MWCRYHRCGYPIIVKPAGHGAEAPYDGYAGGEAPLTHCPGCRRPLADDELLAQPPDPARLIGAWALQWPAVRQHLEARLAAELQARGSSYLYHPETDLRDFEAALGRLRAMAGRLQHLPLPDELPAPQRSAQAPERPAERLLLVPLDGSAAAEAALPHAVRIAEASGGSIRLAQVVRPLAAYAQYPAPYGLALDPLPLWEQARSEAQSYLDSAAGRLAERGVAATTALLEGDPATALLRYVRETAQIAMIVMATHGRSGMRHLFFGSVAEKILHAAPVPLLLARAQPQVALTDISPYRALLVPLDGSAHAEQALPLAHRLARATAADLILLHAVPTPDDLTLANHGYSAGWDDKHLAKLNSRAEAYLQAKASLHAAGGAPVRTLVRVGHAGEQIVAAAREANADLIVMATHGLTGLRRLWLGSVATYVVRHSHQPVLLVRTEPAAQDDHGAGAENALADTQAPG